MAKREHVLTEAEKLQRIHQRFPDAERLYFIYRVTTEGCTLVQVTDRKDVAKTFVAQRESVGENVMVYCARPTQETSRCVYQTAGVRVRVIRAS